MLALLAKAGAGFDIVSGGELFRVLKAGGNPAKVVFSGVGKTAGEVEYALASGIHSFNCESESELALIDAMAARRGVKAGLFHPRQSGRGCRHPSLHLHRIAASTSSASPSRMRRRFTSTRRGFPTWRPKG